MATGAVCLHPAARRGGGCDTNTTLPVPLYPRYGSVTGVMGVVLLKTSYAEVRAVQRIACMGTFNVSPSTGTPEDGLVRIALRGDAASSL